MFHIPLSLIPLSCIVAPNRDIRNIHFLSSAFTSFSAQMANLPSNLVMDINNCNVNNYDDVRKRPFSSSKVSSKSASVSSSASSIPYPKRMVINNDLPNDNNKEPIDSSQLPYKDNSQKGDHISRTPNLVLSWEL